MLRARATGDGRCRNTGASPGRTSAAARAYAAATKSSLAVGSSFQRSTHHLLTAPPHPTRKVPRDRQASCSPEISHSPGPLPRGHGLRAGFLGHHADGSHHLGSVGSLGRWGVVAAAVLVGRRRRRCRLPAREARGVGGGSQVEEGDAGADPERDHLRRQGAQPRQGPAPAEQEEEGASSLPTVASFSTLPFPVSLCRLCFSCSPSRTLSWRGASTSSPRRVTRFVLLLLD